MRQVPITEGLFTWPSDEPRLIASRCLDCDNHMFPTQRDCPKCSGSSTEPTELGRTGTLWTWTVQGYPPKSPPFAGDSDPASFEPFGVGYVEVDGKVRVESRLTVSDPARLEIDAENGFCEHGEQEHMIAMGETEIDGRRPVNTDGGCSANGEPIGASGLRQVYENVLQLRGDAGERQVPGNPSVGYTHVYGAPGISGVTILAR